MSALALILIVAAAMLHAVWNLAAKRQNPSAAFFLVTSVVGALLMSPAVMIDHRVLTAAPARVWGFLAGTGFFMALYYASLAGAYRAGDISVAYPLARSSPIIVVTVVTLFLGRGEQISRQCILGIVLVVAGCVLIPRRRFRDFHLRDYLNATCGLALLAAVGTSGYSILDDEALRTLRSLPGLGIGSTRVTLVYGGLEAASSAVWLAVFILVRRAGRAELIRVCRREWRQAFLAGAAIYAGYVTILMSLAFVRNVSYVVALRQLSIPMGVVFGLLVLKEPPHAPKLTGVAIMLAGLVLVATG